MRLLPSLVPSLAPPGGDDVDDDDDDDDDHDDHNNHDDHDDYDDHDNEVNNKDQRGFFQVSRHRWLFLVVMMLILCASQMFVTYVTHVTPGRPLHHAARLLAGPPDTGAGCKAPAKKKI